MHTNTARRVASLLTAACLAAAAAGCGGKKAPVAAPIAPPPAAAAAGGPPPSAEPVRETPIATPAPVAEDAVTSRSLEELNRNSPLRPVFFEYDSAEIIAPARATLDANAAVLKKYPAWVVTVEGHCDERGTAEYNLALGERRAVAARTYLVSLGIDEGRLRTISYGKEFPFDPDHDETAWARNRRAHFVITAR